LSVIEIFHKLTATAKVCRGDDQLYIQQNDQNADRLDYAGCQTSFEWIARLPKKNTSKTTIEIRTAQHQPGGLGILEPPGSEE
jgi:hypothetical protein